MNKFNIKNKFSKFQKNVTAQMDKVKHIGDRNEKDEEKSVEESNEIDDNESRSSEIIEDNKKTSKNPLKFMKNVTSNTSKLFKKRKDSEDSRGSNDNDNDLNEEENKRKSLKGLNFMKNMSDSLKMKKDDIPEENDDDEEVNNDDDKNPIKLMKKATNKSNNFFKNIGKKSIQSINQSKKNLAKVTSSIPTPVNIFNKVDIPDEFIIPKDIAYDRHRKEKEKVFF